MNTARYVDDLIAQGKAEGKDLQQLAWDAAKACTGWAYVYGAYGEYCDPSNRRSRYRAAHPTIKSKCRNFEGRDDVPAGCVGCQWYLGTAESDEGAHEGRTRFFDCRGYVYWILHHVYGFWEKCPAGCTTMWKTAKNWKAKGTVKDGVPEDTLVCLFVQDGEKMSHIGFGFRGETLECSSGVQHFTRRNKKWTHWAIPACVAADEPVPEPTPEPAPQPKVHPTLRLGAKGEAVKEMQEDLLKAGERLPRYGADGDFGRETLAALRAFQRSHGLQVDGICGPKTWAELDKA